MTIEQSAPSNTSAIYTESARHPRQQQIEAALATLRIEEAQVAAITGVGRVLDLLG